VPDGGEVARGGAAVQITVLKGLGQVLELATIFFYGFVGFLCQKGEALASLCDGGASAVEVAGTLMRRGMPFVRQAHRRTTLGLVKVEEGLWSCVVQDGEGKAKNWPVISAMAQRKRSGRDPAMGCPSVAPAGVDLRAKCV
jgi:hypothetical protein